MARKYETDKLSIDQSEGRITLSLTESQYATLLDVLYHYDDGPAGEEKPSQELAELRVIVEAASLQESRV